jgi:two-component system chemotaxis response regulator CheY
MLNENSKILVIDDYETIRVILKNTLAELGYKNVHEARNGKEAFEMLTDVATEKEPYEILFLDWNMPKMNGFEFLKLCRQNPRFKNLPIVMITAESEHNNIIRVMKMGATDYIVKPINKKVLKKKIETIAEMLKQTKAS